MKNKTKKKIYVDMNGRAGNQLFQYAFARKISLNLKNVEFEFIFDFYNVLKKGRELGFENSFVDVLSNFNVIPYTSLNENGFQLKIHGTKQQKKLLKLYYFLRNICRHFKLSALLQQHQYLMQKNSIYKEDCCNIKFFKKYKKDIFIKGYFEDPSYFEDIRDILVEEFKPKSQPSLKNKYLYDIIRNTESVCISFRIWNEISNNKQLTEQRNVCNMKYYEDAVNKMIELHPNAVFIIFSNDIDTIKKSFKIRYPVYYEDGTDDVHEKLRLMYSCKHFIMSTSTFSWWAQYLSTYENKTVISPNKWYSDGKESKLLSNNWIKIIV